MRRVGWGTVRFLLLRIEDHLSFKGVEVEADRERLLQAVKEMRELMELDARDDRLAQANKEGKEKQMRLVA